MLRNIFTILLLLISINCFAQYPSYYNYDDEKFVGDIEDMNPSEIRAYNNWIEEGVKDTTAIAYINAYRAQRNLKKAPPTLFDYKFYCTDNGEARFNITIINSTPKTIKNLTLKFEFFNANKDNLYDIKTGNKYMTLTFSNLSGRSTSNEFKTMTKAILNCFHELSVYDAVKSSSFTNNKAAFANLVSSSITYNDGTTTHNLSHLENGDILQDGPLNPIFKYVDYMKKKREEAESRIDPNNHSPLFTYGSLHAWLSEHLKYPEMAYDSNVEGVVKVKFAIDIDGSITDAEITKSVDPALDREVLRVVRTMPKWEPGMKDGKPIKDWIELPITFKL